MNGIIPEVKTLLRTGVHAFSAADTLRGAGDFLQGESSWTCSFAGHAGDTLLFCPVDLYQAEPVEQAIDSSKRAQILAEGAVNFYGQHHNAKQDPKLPEEQSLGLTAQGFICDEQGKGTEQGAGGTQIFAERGDFRVSHKQKH